MLNGAISPGRRDSVGEGAGVPAEIFPYSVGVVRGVLGGAAMGVVVMVGGMLLGHGPWYFFNLTAAPLLSLSPEQLLHFDPAGLLVGVVVHLLMSSGLGLLFTLLLPTLPGSPQRWGLVLAPVLWLWARFVFLPGLSSATAGAGWHLAFFVALLVYGLVLGAWVQAGGRVRVEPAEI